MPSSPSDNLKERMVALHRAVLPAGRVARWRAGVRALGGDGTPDARTRLCGRRRTHACTRRVRRCHRRASALAGAVAQELDLEADREVVALAERLRATPVGRAVDGPCRSGRNGASDGREAQERVGSSGRAVRTVSRYDAVLTPTCLRRASRASRAPFANQSRCRRSRRPAVVPREGRRRRCRRRRRP